MHIFDIDTRLRNLPNFSALSIKEEDYSEDSFPNMDSPKMDRVML